MVAVAEVTNLAHYSILHCNDAHELVGSQIVGPLVDPYFFMKSREQDLTELVVVGALGRSRLREVWFSTVAK